MPTETSVVHTWLNAFADALTARANLAGVLITTGYVSDVGTQDAIQIGDSIEGEQEWSLLGNRRRRENFRIGGIIWVKRAGKGDPVIRTVRERAFALLAEVEDELRLRPTVTATAKLSAITRYECDQGASTDGRWCQVEFEVGTWKELAS